MALSLSAQRGWWAAGDTFDCGTTQDRSTEAAREFRGGQHPRAQRRALRQSLSRSGGKIMPEAAAVAAAAVAAAAVAAAAKSLYEPAELSAHLAALEYQVHPRGWVGGNHCDLCTMV